MEKTLTRDDAKKLLNESYGDSLVVPDILEILYPPIAKHGEVIAVWDRKENSGAARYRAFLYMRNDRFVCRNELSVTYRPVSWQFARTLTDEEQRVMR